MAAAARYATLTLLAWSLGVQAQLPRLEARQFSASNTQTVSQSWIQPIAPDKTVILVQGQQFNVVWRSNLTDWFPYYSSSANTSNVNLWVTAVYQAQFQKRIATSINLSNTTEFAWRVDLPTEQVAATNEWIFRFLAANETSWRGSVNGSGEVSSPQISIRNNATTTPTSTAVTATTAIRTGPPTASTTSPVTPTPVSDSGGLSSGAVAGVAIGAAVIALLLAGGAFLLWRRHRRAKKSRAVEQAAALAAAAGGEDRNAPGYTAPYSDKPPYSQTNIHSLPGTPGLPPSHPGTPGLHNEQYMSEMVGSDAHPLRPPNGFYAPAAVPSPGLSTYSAGSYTTATGTPIPPPHNRQHSDPVPPYPVSELHGKSVPPREMIDSESVRRISSGNARSELAGTDGRGSLGAGARRISGGTGGVSRVASPLGHERIEEGDDADATPESHGSAKDIGPAAGEGGKGGKEVLPADGMEVLQAEKQKGQAEKELVVDSK